MIELVLPSAHPNQQSKSIGSAVFAQLTAESSGRLAPPGDTIEIVHIGAVWWTQLNSCFLWPSRVHNSNGKSMGSAVSAQLTVETPCTLQWATLSSIITSSHGESGSRLIHDSLGHSEITIQRAWQSVQPFSHMWLQSVPILCYGMPIPPKLTFLIVGIWTPCKPWFLRPFWAHSPNGITNWFTHFHTGDCGVSLYFTMGYPFSL